MNADPKFILALQQMFNALGELADEFDEFTDTDVRDAVHLTLNHYFVWNARREPFPTSYGMRSAAEDLRIRIVLEQFLTVALAAASEISLGAERLKLLQDRNVRASNGMQYDELFGHRNEPLPSAPLPEHMFLNPTYEL